MDEQVKRLGADLEAAIVRGLLRDFERINYSHLRSGLRTPSFILGDAGTRLGQWSPETRTIEIARTLVLGQPWGIVVEVLKHEMAHQFAHEVLGATSESAHGEAFRRACDLLGIDPAASGLPAPRPATDEEQALPRRIAKLLALAGSPERHEAEAAMREAQRLMLKYNLDVSPASPLRRVSGGAVRDHYGFRHLGEPTGRLQPHQRFLGAILGRFFFVEAIWVTVHRPLDGIPGTVLEVCGTPPNLEMASYVHDFLLHSAERLWQEHKRASGLRGDRDRRSYLAGVMRGFHEKLEAQQHENRREGLIWVKDGGLASFFQQRYPRQRTVHSKARARPDALAHGKQAGRSLVLHRPVAAGPARNGGRLLPPRRA